MSIRSLFATVVALSLVCTCGLNTLFAQQPNPNFRPNGTTGNPVGGVGAPTGGAGQGNPGFGAAAPASAPAARPTASSDISVVVIDISEVFKNHARFKQSIEEIKEQVKGLEAQAQAKQKELAKMKDSLATFTAGSPDYKKLEEEMAHVASDMNVYMGLKQKEVMEKEAKLYYNTYLEVQDLVKNFAERNGIRLVLQHKQIEMDPTKRESVMMGVSRPIIYQYRLDITSEIVNQCNRGVAVKPNPGPPIPRPNGPGGTTNR